MEEVNTKWGAVGNNILIKRFEPTPESYEPTKDANGLVSVVAPAIVDDKKYYEIIGIGAAVNNCPKLGSTIMLQPAAMGGIQVDDIKSAAGVTHIININITDILAVLK